MTILRIGVVALMLLPSLALAKPVARITVDAGKYERADTPVMVALPAGFSWKNFALMEVTEGKRLATQSQVAGEGNAVRLCWILAGTTPAGKQRIFELEKGKPDESVGVDIRETDKSVEVLCGGKTVLAYNHAVEPAPAGMDKNYAKSGFIHPVCSPGGQVLTQIHLPDHIHHMGLWNAWTSTEFEGRKIDFWNIKKGVGTVRFAKYLAKEHGPVFGGFKVVQEHVDLSAPGGTKVALKEDIEVKVWDTRKGYWLFDWISVQKCASPSPLHLLKYRYGGFGFRATEEWDKSNSDYLTSEGKTRVDGHGTRARWCNISGKTTKGPAGILLMADPQNREFPEPIRIWSEKDHNGKVFFNFCPIQEKDWMLEPGRDYVFRYRACVYDGTITKERAEQLWIDLGYPPEVKVEKIAD